LINPWENWHKRGRLRYRGGILKIISLFLIVGFIWVFLDIYLCYKKAKEMKFNKIMLIS